jgi:hypothetical protein
LRTLRETFGFFVLCGLCGLCVKRFLSHFLFP